MERREQYDPEDIESLLSERSFDELLEEERAYVLRHLAGRDEYETMRALLYQVRNDERNEGRITAPPEVRAHVLDVFRQQQQPQWRVWLNSVGGLLWPKEASAMWRPALAFGTVALLITAGVFVFRQADEGHAELAELKPVKAAEAEKKEAAIVPALDSARSGALSSALELQEAAPARELERTNTDAAGHVAPPPVVEQGALTFDQTATGATVQDFDIATISTDEAPAEEGEMKLGLDDLGKQSAAAPASTSHQVTEVELARNESLANATGRTRVVSKEKFKKGERDASASSRSLGDDVALVSLLNSGW